MRYLSLFSGIGGFELGIQQAYESNFCRSNREAENEKEPTSIKSVEECESDMGELGDNADCNNRPSPICIGFSEIDKYATEIYQKHFPEHKSYGDITKINEKELPDFDLLVGGFPCQAFSIAGKRKGFEDTRGTMFFEIARIVREKQPRLLLLENVKGLLSHDKGNTFTTIITTLDELGYDCQWQVLNSKNHGVPQNRERVFIIGHLRGTPRPKVFPFTTCSEKNLKEYTKGASQGYRTYSTEGISTTLASEAGGVGAKTGLYMSHINRSKKEYDVKITENAGTLTATMYKGIDASGRTGAVQNGAIRRLTPTECERLQGFPDEWTKGLSDTQRYKTLGNAVTVNVIKDIMVNIFKQ